MLIDADSEPDVLTIFINDAAIFGHADENQSNETCASGQIVQRRDLGECVVKQAVQAFDTFVNSKSHAFKSLWGMPRLPAINNPDLQDAITQFLKWAHALISLHCLRVSMMIQSTIR